MSNNIIAWVVEKLQASYYNKTNIIIKKKKQRYPTGRRVHEW